VATGMRLGAADSPGAAESERRERRAPDAAKPPRRRGGDGEERERRDRQSRAAGGRARCGIGVGRAEERIRLGDRARLQTRNHIANLRLAASTARLAARRGRRTARRAV